MGQREEGVRASSEASDWVIVMATSANTVYEVRTTGDDDNGGGFVTGASGTDYSQQDAAQKSGTDLAVHASDNTKVQPVAAGVSANDVGNIIQITAGTGFTTGFYEITAQDGTYWTLDRSPAATSTTGGTYAMGGCLASPGKLTDAWSSFGDAQKAWIKAGTYLLTTSTPGAGGPLDLGNVFTDGLVVEGYQTTRGDRGTRPLIDSNGETSIEIFRGPGNGSLLAINIEIDGTTPSDGCDGFATCATYSCIARNCHYGMGLGGHCKSAAYDCTDCFRFPTHAFGCYAEGASGNGFNFGGQVTRCIAVDCNVGFTNEFNLYSCSNCVAYGCGTGFGTNGAAGSQILVSCIAMNSSGYGFNGGGQSRQYFIGCAGYSNTSGNFSGGVQEGSLTLTADPFVDGANGDFRLNNVAGGGAVLRGVGIGTFGQV